MGRIRDIRVGCYGLRRTDEWKLIVTIYDPREYAAKLEKHLKIRSELELLEPKEKEQLRKLSSIEKEIFENSRDCDKLQIQLGELQKVYDSYNFRLGLGTSDENQVLNKRLRNDTWEKIYETKKERDEKFEKIQNLRFDRDHVSQNIGHIRRKYEDTKYFLEKYEKSVNLYSIVSVDFMGKDSTFILVTEYQRPHVSVGNLDIYSIESPLGGACLEKKVGESISCLLPSGNRIEGLITSCHLPSLEQMQEIISGVNRALVSKPDSGPKVDLDSWTSNNSRFRKQGG